jgi:hypothetical protein
MFREMQYMDRSLREQDLAEKMDERRRQSLATTRKPSLRASMVQIFSALPAATERPQAEGRA